MACSSLISGAQHQDGCAKLPTDLGENPVFIASLIACLTNSQHFVEPWFARLSGMHIANLNFCTLAFWNNKNIREKEPSL